MRPDDLDQIGQRLRDLRPSLPEDRLQRTAARARTAARQATHLTAQGKDSGMRSRLAITLMLVFGFALSGAGAGLAVTGSGDTAADAQYQNPAAGGGGTPSNNPAPTPTLGGGGNGVAGETDTDDGDEGVGGNAPDTGSGNAPTTSGDGGVAGDVQESRQLGAQSGGDELPFTGLAAIPILIMGIALVSAGLALRRGSRSAS